MSNGVLFMLFLANLFIAGGYVRDKDFGLAVTFACYGIACLGFIWSNHLRGL